MEGDYFFRITAKYDDARYTDSFSDDFRFYIYCENTVAMSYPDGALPTLDYTLTQPQVQSDVISDFTSQCLVTYSSTVRNIDITQAPESIDSLIVFDD